MEFLRERFTKAALVSLIFLSMVALAGCSTTEMLPPSNIGVLSAMHQRALNAATARAIEQAGVDEEFLGPGNVFLDIKAVGAADLGKQHVNGTVMAELDTLGARILDSPARADATISCFINVAGTDADDGEFLFWKWEEVKADVVLSFSKTTGRQVIKKQGVGTATYNETWFLGFGPETKIR